MAYYRGDYYRGDYYRGDLGGFLKKAGGALVGAAKGFITGGPVGALAGGVGALTAKSQSAVLPIPSIATAGIGSVAGKVVGTAVRLLPGAAAAVGLEKALGLFGRDGMRKRRTMNHLNPRALSRATRRVEGFVKKARKAVSPLGYTIQRRGAGTRAKKRCR